MGLLSRHEAERLLSDESEMTAQAGICVLGGKFDIISRAVAEFSARDDSSRRTIGKVEAYESLREARAYLRRFPEVRIVIVSRELEDLEGFSVPRDVLRLDPLRNWRCILFDNAPDPERMRNAARRGYSDFLFDTDTPAVLIERILEGAPPAFDVEQRHQIFSSMLERRSNQQHWALSGEFWDILLLLFLSEKPVSVHQVAVIIHTSEATASRKLVALEQAGYVERAADPLDRRRRAVCITETGASLIRSIIYE